MPDTITTSGFQQMIRDGSIRPGDLVLFRNGERGPLNWIIRRAQERMIRDLDPDAAKDVVAWAAAYTHAACLYDGMGCAEMYHPKARLREWSEALTEGTRILVRRPQILDDFHKVACPEADITKLIGKAIAAEAFRDVEAKTPYPTRELLTYYLWSWGVQKLRRGRHFVDVFKSKSTDVCSGRYWLWCRRAGRFANVSGTTDDLPEAWYPARLAVSARFRTVGEYEISASPGVDPIPSSPAPGEAHSLDGAPA
jgi:hypothetical protein